MTFDFDTVRDRRGTNSAKWDKMQELFRVAPEDGLAMWTADSDYPTAPCVIDAVKRAAEHGLFGYSWLYPAHKEAVAWWMQVRHGWEIDPDWVLASQGLGNAIASCIQVWSEPGDHVVTFNPVYHEFALKIAKTGRKLTECPLVRVGDRYELDLDDAQSRMTGKEKLLLWCSPQNPSGRIWTEAELTAVSEFAARNGLILVSDEIHHDLVYPGHRYVPTHLATPEGQGHTIYLTAASKTFNIAGQRTGNMIIPDDNLRSQMVNFQRGLDYSPSALGIDMITAAYSPEGAAWVDAQMTYLDGNRRLIDEGLNAIPGVYSLPLQSTFLAWVDFSGTGMSHNEVAARIRDDAKIAVSPGPSFGAGGDGFQRINFAAPRSIVQQAVDRLQGVFADLQ